MKKTLITEIQLNTVLEALLLESKLGNKAWQIAKTYYPNLTEPRYGAGGVEFRPFLTETHLERIAEALNAAQAYSAHNLNWLLELMSKANNTAAISNIFEDLDQYARFLRKFDENKQKIIAAGGKPELWQQTSDGKVLNYKNKQELYNAVAPFFKSKDTGGDMMYPKVKHYVETGDFEFVGETSTWYIVKIKTGHNDAVIDIQRGPSPEDAKEYTKWCTRVAGTYFDNYMKQAPLFMLINKQTAKTTNRLSDPKSMLQFHWGRTLQFRDREDNAYEPDGNAASLTQFFKDYPDVYPIFFQGIIDIIMDPDITPLFPVTIDKTSIPDELKAMYKYKLERAIVPKIAERFKVKENDVNVFEYAMRGIRLNVRNGVKYDTVLGRNVKTSDEFILMPDSATGNFFSEQKFTITKLIQIQGLISSINPSSWAKYIDINKFIAEINHLIKDDTYVDSYNIIFQVKKALISGTPIEEIFNTLYREMQKDIKANFSNLDDVNPRTRAIDTFFNKIKESDIIDNDVVVEQISNPSNNHLGVQIISTDIVLDMYTSEFSEVGITLENFYANMQKTKMTATKTRSL